MTQAETIEKIVEDTAERIMREIEEERCIHKSSLVREIKAGIEASRTAGIMERMRRELLEVSPCQGYNPEARIAYL